MFQLLCDKCGKKIEHDEKIIEMILEEKCFDGHAGFIIKPSHLRNSGIICKDCAESIYQMLNANMDRFDF